MFSWCKTCETQPVGSGYLVQRDQEPPKFYPKFADIKETDLKDQKVSVLHINKSEYDTFSKSLTGKERKFVDQDFPPSDKSLGNFEHVKTDKWKRISEINPNITFFNKQVTHTDGVASNGIHNIGFQAAVAAIAQKPERLTNLFGQSAVNPNSIYTFLLRHRGRIEEVIIDDYVPIDEDGSPLFAKSNQGSVWVALLEKARAKLHGSYEIMTKNSQHAKQTLQEITFANNDTFKNANVNKDDLWNRLTEAVQKGSIALAQTNKSQKINWNSISLTPNHFYTILDAANLPHKLGSSFKVLKLRNAFKHEQYKGEGSLTDTLFWDQIQNCDEKARILLPQGPKEGIIYLLFSDYLKYFEETLINYYEGVRNFFNEPCEFTSPNGLVYDLTVQKEGFYSVSLEQTSMQPQKKGLEYIDEGWGRATLLLLKDDSIKGNQNYEFLSGILKYNEQNTHLRSKLAPGKYLIYAKVEPTIKNNNFPKNITLSIHSTQSVPLKQTLQQNTPNLLKKSFLNHARTFKRQLYNNDLMWSSWKLIAQGGYAYIAFGNSSESKSKFVISFKEEIFNKQNYILKKPFKGKGEQSLQILPGQEEIILLRIKNSEVKEINFPPPIDLQIIAA